MDWKFLLKTNAGNLIHRHLQKHSKHTQTGNEMSAQEKKIHQNL